MRLSLNLTNYSWQDGQSRLRSHLAEVAEVADRAGVDTLWLADHLIQADPTSTLEAEMLEAYTTLGFLASQTARVRLGTMVSAVTYRPASLLVKAVTTLDVLSGGRAWLGIGAGYQEQEAAAMGLPLPPMGERFAILEDTVRLALQMWSGDDAAFDGAHVRAGRPISNPSPVARPHPPILLGGAGERSTLRLVARYADACNLFDIPDGGATIRHKLDVLARHCEAADRPYGEIEKTVSTRLRAAESVPAFVAHCRELASYGIDHAVVITDGPWTEDRLTTLASAVPEVQAI